MTSAKHTYTIATAIPSTCPNASPRTTLTGHRCHALFQSNGIGVAPAHAPAHAPHALALALTSRAVLGHPSKSTRFALARASSSPSPPVQTHRRRRERRRARRARRARRLPPRPHRASTERDARREPPHAPDRVPPRAPPPRTHRARARTVASLARVVQDSNAHHRAHDDARARDARETSAIGRRAHDHHSTRPRRRLERARARVAPHL